MTDLERILDRLVPEPAADGDWEQVLVDAQRPRRTSLAFALPLGAVVAAVAAVALAWPFEGERPAPVLVRALAAIGDGPVLHVTFRSDWGASLVDLSTGEVTPVYSELEAWYDPARGLKQISRLGGTVTGERFYRPGQLYRPMTQRFDALATHYREALESGEAKVVTDGRVGDRPVHWIRINSSWHLNSRDAREHLFAEEVAVDAETFEPVYLRSTFDGRSRPGRSYGELITKVETLPEDEVDFTTDTSPDERPRYYGERFGRGLDRKALERAVPGGALVRTGRSGGFRSPMPAN
jgi:hypothetical protein